MQPEFGRIFALTDGPPFHPGSFSGSLRQLLRAIDRRGHLAGAADVSAPRRLEFVPTGLALWNAAGKARFDRRYLQLVAKWSPLSMKRRSARAEDALLAATRERAVDAAFLYGTSFFPARDGQAPVVPVFASMDATFAQIARSREGPYAKLTYRQTRDIIERQRGVFHRCRGLLPRSEWCASSLVDDYGIERSKIVVIGAGPGLDMPFRVRDEHAANKIVFVGKDDVRKQLQLVLDTFRLVREVRSDTVLRVAGPRCELDPRQPGVEWLGRISWDDRESLWELYRESSLLLFPSRFEPFGLAALEAMNAGCPVIMLRHCAAPEFIRDGETGSLLNGDAEPGLFARVVLDWLADPARLVRAGQQAQRMIREQYSWDLAAQRVIDATRMT